MLKLLGLSLVMAAPIWTATVLPLHFEANQGQSASDVRYLARVRDATVYLTSFGFRVDGRGGRSEIWFIGSSPQAHWTASGRPAGTTSYLIGNDSSRWLRDLPNFSRVESKDIYPGIDMVAYGTEGRLEYNF